MGPCGPARRLLASRGRRRSEIGELDHPTDDALGTRAIALLKKRRDFRAHLLVYVLVNAAFVMVWVVTGGDTFFWPVFPLVFGSAW